MGDLSEWYGANSNTSNQNKAPQGAVPLNSQSATDLSDWYGTGADKSLPVPTPKSPYEGTTIDDPETAQLAQQQYKVDQLARGQRISATLGGEGKFDPEGTFGEPGNLRDAYTVQDLARSGDIQDKLAKFRKMYGDSADIRVIPFEGTKILVARKSPDEPYKELGIGGTLIGKGASFSAGLAVAGEALGMKTEFPLLSAPVGAFGGSLIGSEIDNSIEKLRGYAKDDSLVTAEAGKEAAAQFVTSAIMRGGTTLGLLKNSMNYETRPLIDKAIDFADRQGLPSIITGQALEEGSLGQAIYAQALQLNKKVAKIPIQQTMAARSLLTDKIAELGFDGVDPNVIQGLIDDSIRGLRTTIAGMKSGTLTQELGAKILQREFKNWQLINQVKNDSLYNSAFNLSKQDLSFDISRSQAIAKEEIDGVLGAGKPTTTTSPPSKALPWGGPGVTNPEIQVTLEPAGQLRTLLDRTMQLQSTITKLNSKNGNTYEAFTTLKNLRSSFGDLTQSNDPQVARIAKRMYGQLSSDIENVTSNIGNAADEAAFVKTWQDANVNYKTLQDLSKLRYMTRLDDLEPGEYAQFSDNLLKPGKGDLVKLVGETVPNGKDTMKGMLLNEMLADGALGNWKNRINTVFSRFEEDPSVLNYLLSSDEQKGLIAYARNRDELENSLLMKLSKDSRVNSVKAIDLATKGDTEGLDLILRVAGGPNSKTGQSIQAGFIQHLIDSAKVDIPTYGQGLDGSAFLKLLSHYESNGTAQKILSQEQINFLKETGNYAVTVGHQTTGFGSSLMGGSYGSLLRESAITIPGALVSGNEKKATKVVEKILKMPFSMEIAGYFLRQPAIKGGVKGGIANGTYGPLNWANKVTTSLLVDYGARQDSNSKDTGGL